MTKPNSNAVNILVIEDEPDLCEAMVSYLNLEGFLAHGVGSTSNADAWLSIHNVDILILDIGLPDRDGITWLNQVAALPNRGIIMATARHELTDRLRGLKAGADAYLVKPIELDELRAIVHNVANRIGLGKAISPSSWRLNAVNWSLTSPDEYSIKLTRSETILLKALATQPGSTIPKSTLIHALGLDPETYDLRRMEILVRRLRNKVSRLASIPLPLETVHGMGYAFVADITLATSSPSEKRAPAPR
jgi:DNA-binding response OmpR family regulator